MGARPLTRVIKSKLQDPLAEDIIAEKINAGDTVYVTASDDDLVISTEDMLEKSQDACAPQKKAT
jgi:ATP-dependent Clp protease ATP-binding subunit ClpA